MAYKSNYATGDLIDATAFQELVNSAVYSFANLTAIQSNDHKSNRWTNCIRTRYRDISSI